MMAKALLDGRFFPLRISFALARCICGQELEFDDLGSIISYNKWDALKRLRELISSGAPINDTEWEYFENLCLDFTQPTFIAQPGSKGIRSDISKVFHLVKDGHLIDVSRDNAADYLREFERLHLRDGVLMQLRALKSGFYSIIPRVQVAVLGPSGLLHLLGCLDVPQFDSNDMREGIVPQDPYNSQSPQFLWLLEILKSFDAIDRCNFLRFVTGSPCLPSGGFRGLKFKGIIKPITVQKRKDDRCNVMGDSDLPFASTCFGVLHLPE
jgi:hypothetical protein